MPHERPEPSTGRSPHFRCRFGAGFGSAGFSLWVLVHARTNPPQAEACATRVFPPAVTLDAKRRFLTADFLRKVLRGRLVPSAAADGTSGPEDRSRRLPLPSGRTARRTITAQRARTHPQAWAQRRRDIVERSATIAAQFSSGVDGPQPVAASRTLRINALHSPSRQILHAFSPCGMTRHFFRSGRLDQIPTEKVAGILRRRSCGVKGKDTIPSGGVANRPTRRRTLWPLSEKIPGEIFFPPLQPFRACPQSVLPIRETKGKNVFVCGRGHGTR